MIVYMSSTTQINDDQWHMITVSNDGANATLYVDGVVRGDGDHRQQSR